MIKAWHFVGDKLRDGRPVPADGEVLRHDGPIKWCESGLYASRRIMNALHYATGNTICRVECNDIVQSDYDKFVCRERTILWRVDGDELLRRFARKCALDVIHLWDAPNVVIRYLKTGDESLRDRAQTSAWNTARIWSAAWAATWYATGSAVWDTEAQTAARAAARATDRAKQNRRLTAMACAARKQ